MFEFLIRIAHRSARRIASDQRGTVFVKYSSLALLIAIAAIALLSHVVTPSN